MKKRKEHKECCENYAVSGASAVGGCSANEVNTTAVSHEVFLSRGMQLFSISWVPFLGTSKLPHTAALAFPLASDRENGKEKK